MIIFFLQKHLKMLILIYGYHIQLNRGQSSKFIYIYLFIYIYTKKKLICPICEILLYNNAFRQVYTVREATKDIRVLFFSGPATNALPHPPQAQWLHFFWIFYQSFKKSFFFLVTRLTLLVAGPLKKAFFFEASLNHPKMSTNFLLPGLRKYRNWIGSELQEKKINPDPTSFQKQDSDLIITPGLDSRL